MKPLTSEWIEVTVLYLSITGVMKAALDAIRERVRRAAIALAKSRDKK